MLDGRRVHKGSDDAWQDTTPKGLVSRAMSYSFSGQRVRQRRAELGVSLPQLAVAAGRSVEAIRNYEAGRSTPSAEVVGLMSAALDWTPGDFYEVVEKAAA